MSQRPASLIHHAPCADCTQHMDHGSGCAVLEAASRVPLDGFLRRRNCYLKEQLRAFAGRYLGHRPRTLLEPEDLVQEVFTRLLRDPDLRRGGFARGLLPFLAYLRKTALRTAINWERRERGRVRCGNCLHFAPYSHLCLKSDHAHTHAAVEPSQDPRSLDPSCREFIVRRQCRSLDVPAQAAVLQGDRDSGEPAGETARAVQEALVVLAEVHPRAALVVRARLLEGKSYRNLQDLGASVRTMKRDFALGVAFLRDKLGARRDGILAPDRPQSRSGSPEEP